MSTFPIEREMIERVHRQVFQGGMAYIVAHDGQKIEVTEDEFVAALKDENPVRPPNAMGIKVTEAGYEEINRLCQRLYDGYVTVGGEGSFLQFMRERILTILPPGTPAFHSLVFLKVHEVTALSMAENTLERLLDGGNGTVH